MKLELSDKEAKYLLKALINSHGDTEEDFDTNDITQSSPKDFIIGKLVQFNTEMFNEYNQTRRDRFERLPLKKKLFMGNGYHSMVVVNLLHKRLAWAASELSGLEQNGGMGTTFDSEMDKECTQNIKDVIKDIMIAFDVKPEDLCEPKQITCDECGFYHPGGTCYDS